VDSPKERTCFPLRLAASLSARAKLLATRDGVSLNHFISLAVAEKISRLESAEEDSTSGKKLRENAKQHPHNVCS
jgi:hypothetical protein